MEKLSPNWFIEGLIDPEYKRYLLLAYLKNAEEKFDKNELYPHLADLVFHYRNLKHFLDKKEGINEQFPKEMSGIDLKRMQVAYSKVIQDDELMHKIQEIVYYSLDRVKEYVEEGKEIYNFIEQQIEMKPIGMMALNPDVGYILMINGPAKRDQVYSYKIRGFGDNKNPYKGIATQFVKTYPRSIATTYENIKSELVKKIKQFSSPGVYAFETGLKLPVNETFLPIAKRMLLRYMTQ